MTLIAMTWHPRYYFIISLHQLFSHLLLHVTNNSYFDPWSSIYTHLSLWASCYFQLPFYSLISNTYLFEFKLVTKFPHIIIHLIMRYPHVILHRVGGTCWGLQTQPLNFSRSLFPTSPSVLQSLCYNSRTVEQTASRRLSFLKASWSLANLIIF
jgi:hypothetical protein